MLELTMKLSKSELPIPVVNGVHLHSAYNPIKEAETFVDKYESILAEKKEVLVLGLGFAYHINQIINRLRKNHSTKYQVVVIEPSRELVEEFVKSKNGEDIDFTIYAEDNMANLFHDEKLINFLLRKPGIIPHPPSFNLHNEYFKKFLSFESPKKIGELKILLRDASMKSFLSQFDENLHLEEVILANQNNPLSKEDMLMSMLSEFRSGVKQ